MAVAEIYPQKIMIYQHGKEVRESNMGNRQKEQYAAPKCFLNSGPLVSVVIPAYNMEKYLGRCLDSVIAQTYENLEIIVVDDCSADETAKIIRTYMEQDSRIKQVAHEENRGLFQARITGADAASGKYLAFIDSDDYVSVDWFRTMVKKAESSGADITVGDWCFDYGNRKEFCNLDPFRLKEYDLEGEEVLKAFMEQEGRSFSWTVVWNKLYAKRLWDECRPDFVELSERHGHMLMWEDIAFSSNLWCHARKVVNVRHVNYFYWRHQIASTAPDRSTKRNLKYISDASAAMNFMRQCLEQVGSYECLREYYQNWKSRYVSIIYQDIVIDLNKKSLLPRIREAFDYTGKFSERDLFFYHLTSPLQPAFTWQEDVKKEIVSNVTKYVSFDVFDTLIQRPFLEPTDLFFLLNDEFNRFTSAYVDFVAIRRDAEMSCREELRLHQPSKEDITLDEIYGQMEKRYALDSGLLRQTKELEIALELRLCYARNFGKELYELAKDAGKQIVICSDMYLSADTISKILLKNGYGDYKKLYLSSELKITKAQKSLFKYMKKDLGCKTGLEIVHIGDNWASDIENARACGLRSCHICKAADMLQNWNPGIYSGMAFQKIYQRNDQHEDNPVMLRGFTGMRSAMGLVANRLYDNPYVSFHPQSDFNADPNNIGYFALGPHLLAVVEWIMHIAVKKKIPVIHFVARDGYLVKKAFDAINTSNVRSGYIRLSRKALILADVDCKEDLYSIYNKVNVSGASPKDLQEYFAPIIPDRTLNDIPSIMKANNLFYDRKFGNHAEYARCMRVFIEQIIDFSMLTAYKKELKDYFSEFVKPGDYIFDIGYSGRPESSLTNILGYPIGSLYIHVNSDIAEKRQKRYACPSETFYSYKPCITGVMREHLLMELGPSTIGYQLENGKLKPLFESYKPDYESEFVTRIVQSAALDFVNDYWTLFQDRMVLPKDALCAPFEYYLHYSKPFDREIFSSLKFEDKLGEGKTLSALAFWNHEIAIRGLSDTAPAAACLPPELEGLYVDGLFVKLYGKMNRWFPKGSKGRNFLKRVIGIFVH